MALASSTHRTSINSRSPWSRSVAEGLYTLVGRGPSRRITGALTVFLYGAFTDANLGSIVTPGAVTRPRTGAMAATLASTPQSIMVALATAIRRALPRSLAMAAALLLAVASPLLSARQAVAADAPAGSWVVQELKGAA